MNPMLMELIKWVVLKVIAEAAKEIDWDGVKSHADAKIEENKK